MKMNACASVGSVWPTFSVPGIRSSRTRPLSLKIAVVGANEPMPSVSKKFVTKPIASSSGDGLRRASPRRTRRAPAHDGAPRARAGTGSPRGTRPTKRAVFMGAEYTRGQHAPTMAQDEPPDPHAAPFRRHVPQAGLAATAGGRAARDDAARRPGRPAAARPLPHPAPARAGRHGHRLRGARTRASAAASPSRRSPSPTTRRASASGARRAPRRASTTRTSARSTRSARTAGSSSSRWSCSRASRSPTASSAGRCALAEALPLAQRDARRARRRSTTTRQRSTAT